MQSDLKFISKFYSFINRMLSRSRSLLSEHLRAALDVMKKANPEAAFQYSVDQTSCEQRKKKTQISTMIKKMWASTKKSDKKSRISAIIKKMRDMRKQWTTPKSSTTETMVFRTQDTHELATQSALTYKSKFSMSQNIDNSHNASWRFDSKNFLYSVITYLYISQFVLKCNVL